MGLPGVKVGPLDPDSTAGFGQVAARNSARQLIRLHRQLHPPALVRALGRPRDDSHSKAVLENLEAVGEYVGGLAHDNGDPVLPEGARINGAAVRGEPGTEQVLTFTYEMPSGRVGKWHAPYAREHLPDVFDTGAGYAQVKEMKDRGVVSLDSEGTRAEILDRHNRQLMREVQALRAHVERGQGDPPEESEASRVTDTRDSVNLAAENERLGRENQEMRERLAQFDALQSAQGGGMNIAGADELVRGQGERQGEGEGEGEAARGSSVAAEDPPFEGYDAMKADDLTKYLRAEDRTDEERRAVLEFERTHANRKSVVAAAEETLGSGSGS